MVGPESGDNVDSGGCSNFHGEIHPHERKSNGNGTIFRFVWRYSRGFLEALLIEKMQQLWTEMLRVGVLSKELCER